MKHGRPSHERYTDSTEAIAMLNDALQKELNDTAREYMRETIRVLRLPRPRNE